jgi:hypothetical protein
VKPEASIYLESTRTATTPFMHCCLVTIAGIKFQCSFFGWETITWVTFECEWSRPPRACSCSGRYRESRRSLCCEVLCLLRGNGDFSKDSRLLIFTASSSLAGPSNPEVTEQLLGNSPILGYRSQLVTMTNKT